MTEVYITANPHVSENYLKAFYPLCAEQLPLPNDTPREILSEFREAELCAANQAYRGASALLRSTLEKVLKLNGYSKGNLLERIREACAERSITQQRESRAQEIRLLGNDVLHDEWRAVDSEEVEKATHYTQRIIEDFYDNRDVVKELLMKAGRLKAGQSEAS
jgi:hypothetical protein